MDSGSDPGWKGRDCAGACRRDGGEKEPIVLRVKLKNASLLPASCVAVTVGWRDLLDNSTGTVESMGMAGGKRTGVLEFCIPVKYSGVYEFWIQSASVRDWLRLWSKKLLITDKKVQVLSVPLVHQAEEWIPPAQLASGGDSDQHSQKGAGTMDRRYSRFVPIGMEIRCRECIGS